MYSVIVLQLQAAKESELQAAQGQFQNQLNNLNSSHARETEQLRQQQYYLTSQMNNLTQQYQQQVAELKRQQQQKIDQAKQAVYEEFKQKESKKAEERRKFKEQYPVPKFLNPNAINVAITGPSGAGKSTLVNSMRGIKHGEEGEANTSVNECTFDPISYTFAKGHPLHNIVHLWDLPGTGTAAFPQETYIQNMGIRWYDAVIVVGDTRVRDVDVSLMEELKRTLVRFVYVRTKMDHQVKDDKLKNISPQQTFKDIRENLKTKSNIQRPYLIGLKYILKKGLDEWENTDFVELKQEMQKMIMLSAEENKKTGILEAVDDADLKL